MKSIGRGRLVCGAVLLAIVPNLAACSGPSSTSRTRTGAAVATASSTAGPAAVSTSGLTKGLILPLEAYEETYPESQAIVQARLDLENQCMSQYGFSLHLADTTANQAINYDASNMARRYGLADLSTAESDGYLVLQAEAGAPSEPAMSTAERYVLTGSTNPAVPQPARTSSPGDYAGKQIPAGGCVGEAERGISALPTNLLADQLDAQSLTTSEADPAVIEVTAKWSACMKQHGFTVASPYDASQLSGQSGAAPGGSLDRTIAVDDVECKQSTNLVTVWFGVETRLQNQYIATNQQALKQQQSELEAAVKSATAIVAGS